MGYQSNESMNEDILNYIVCNCDFGPSEGIFLLDIFSLSTINIFFSAMLL